MFPQTPHIECVALLEKEDVSRAASASPPASTPRSRGRSPPAAPSSATPRCGRTTTPARKGLETLAEFAARRRDVELGVAVIALDRHAAGARSPPTSSGSASTAARLWLGVGAGFSKKPLTPMRESLPRAARDAPRRPPRPRRDGAEDVRARRRRLRRRLLQLDDARSSPPAPASRSRRGAARGRPRDAAGLRLRPHRRRPRRRRAPRQGGVLLPRPPRRLPQPLRPPRRARGHGRRRRRRPRRGAQAALAAYDGRSTPSSSAASPAPRSRR